MTDQLQAPLLSKADKIAFIAGLLLGLSPVSLEGREERAVNMASRIVELSEEAAQELPVLETFEQPDEGDVDRIEGHLGPRAAAEFREERAHGAL